MKMTAPETLWSIESTFAQLSGSLLEYDRMLSGNVGMQQALKLLSERVSLTEAELSVLECFACGADLRQIAASRQRSYTTIRNQFQAILEKTGCQSQTDLLRILLGLSHWLATRSRSLA